MKLKNGMFIAAAALFLLLGLFLARPQLKDEAPNLSFSADTDGVKAWRELLEKRQAPVGEWRLRWEELPAEGSGRLLIAAGPGQIPPKEWEAMDRWLRAGNHLLLLSSRDNESDYWNLTGMQSAAGEAAEKEGKGPGDGQNGKEAPKVSVVNVKALGAGDYTAEVTTDSRIENADGLEPLVTDGNGVLAGRVKVGAGSATLVVEPRWMQNEAALNASHPELIGALLAGGWPEIMFDEQHHGYVSKKGMFAVYPDWLLLSSILLLIGLLLWLWHAGKRFGPVRIPREWSVRRGDETARALASWYERFGLMDDALDRQRRRLRQQLSQRWGLNAAATPEQAAAAAASRWSEADAQRLQRALEERPIAASGRKAAKREFVARSRETSELAELLRGSRPSGRGEIH
ncbi:DUF4350 domain-containing protein [Paenibacillus pasadenensis]|uniref:DUF4350 domain-containing protein n=1 Tax=Paenibacillus pasadenensis TaxID=217090 RepID=UPI00203B227D|nr:DUF4350 domain-containing protein [Paenibacillus pasadenensis]MCM3748723.1 DUF4350 domain-containing protein [Paenibacillus pasadenensis]